MIGYAVVLALALVIGEVFYAGFFAFIRHYQNRENRRDTAHPR